MAEVRRKRIEQIDIARGIAAICMILGHSFIVHPIDISNVPWCHSMHMWIYSFHMELFFFLTGAVWSCYSWKDYIKKKSLRILVPYTVFGILSILLRMLGTSVVNNNESLGEGITNFVFRGGGYWFLYVLFLMYLLYLGLDCIAKKIHLDDFWNVVISMILSIVCSFVKMPTAFMIDSLIYYLPFFMLARYIIGSKECWPNKDNKGIVHIFLTAITGLIVYVFMSIWGNPHGIVALQQIKALAMIAVVCAVVDFLVWSRERYKIVLMETTNKILSECGKYTLQLYLFNGYLLVIIRTIVVSMLKIYNPVIIVVLVTIGNLIITMFLCRKVLPKIPIIRTLCGLS